MPGLKRYRLTVSGDRLKVRRPLDKVFIGAVFIIAGAFLILLTYFDTAGEPWVVRSIMYLFGAVMFFIGLILLICGIRPAIVFDKRSNVFRIDVGVTSDGRAAPGTAGIDDIKEIQLVPRFILGASEDGSQVNYAVVSVELVFKTGSRVKLMHYGDGEAAMEDAQTLADFIKKPVCDIRDVRPITWGDKDPFGGQ